MDSMDAKNILTTCPSEGIQYLATPAWKRSQVKARKRYADEIICVDGATVNASQPRRAKRVSAPKMKRKLSDAEKTASELQILQQKTDAIETLLKTLISKSGN